MLLAAVHRTLYRYPVPATDSHNEVRLMPLTDACQTCHSFRLRVAPHARVHHYREPAGTVHHFTLREPHSTLEVEGTAVVETHLSDPLHGVNLVTPDLDHYSQESVRQAYAEYLAPSPYVGIHPEAAEIAEVTRRRSNGSVADFAIVLNRMLHELLEYDPDVTHVHSTVEEVLRLRAGVCQDFAHAMIAICRAIGIPARYVSGYLYYRISEPVRGAQATHAWVEVPLPDGRWFAMDPTNNLLANDHYIRVHTGRDYRDVAPTRGVYVGLPAETLEVSVTVEPAVHAPA